MKLITQIFSKLYKYSTICIVVGSPLFFIPKTSFAPEVTYYITMTILVTVALISYCINAILTKTWHSLSKLEFISYFVFVIAVVLSVIFSSDPKSTMFGSIFNPLSGAMLLTLPAIMYLTRTLPENIRHKLKQILVIILGVSAFAFVTIIMFTGKIIDVVKDLFAGFASTTSISVYLGLFAIACLLYVKKSSLSKSYKISIAVVAVLFMAWGASLYSQDTVRPNFVSSVLVGKSVMLKEGIFGIGAGNFDKAWQMYKPQSVLASPYFGYDFGQGADTMTTMFVNIGIIGLLAFLMLTLSALYVTFISYRRAKNEEEHFILGMLTLALLYFSLISWAVPVSYAILVLWMVIAGLGIAKAELTEYHPHKRVAFVMIPLCILLGANFYFTIEKTRAFNFYNKSQKSKDSEEVNMLLLKASSIYKFDGFYRAQSANFIQANRVLVASTTIDKEEMKNIYLQNASSSVNAGLEAVKANPSNYQNYVTLGQAYELAIPFEKEAGYARAKKSYEEALKIYPENPYIYIMLARLEAQAGTKEGVRLQLTEALKKKQNFADALYLMSQLEASENKIDEAISYALEAIKNAPQDPLTYTQAGLLYYGKKDYQNAVTSLNTALEKDPNNANVAYFLALALRDGGRSDLAKQIGDELLKRNPGNADLEAFLKSIEDAGKKDTGEKTTQKTSTKK